MNSDHQKMQTDYLGIVGRLFAASDIFKVPLYQRHYVWDSINWGHLWADIEEKSDLRNNKDTPKEHFTGAIVIQEVVPNSLHEIIDGQQRLTTFQIILCTIRDICDDFKVPEAPTANNYICLEDLTPLTPTATGVQCKLLPREGSDRDAFLSLVERKDEKVEGDNLIWQAYTYFTDKIIKYVTDESGEFDCNKLLHLYDSIVHDFKVVTITANSDYAKIFKSINGTGRRLDQFDLLRNDLFLRAEGTNRDDLYRKYWFHFEEEPNWRKDKVVDNFLKDFLKIKLGQDFEEQFTLFDLYGLYCTKLAKELNLSETDPKFVEHEFYDLKRYSSVYHDLHTVDSEIISGQIKFYDEFNDKLNVVDQLKLFILCISNEFELSNREFNGIFNLFEAYVVRGMLHIGSKGYNSPPLGKLKDVFLRALDPKKSLSIVNLVHQLSGEWATDQEIKFALRMLPKTEVRRKGSDSNLMREFGGRYIFNVLNWGIDHETEFFDKFCEKWPSPEVILQKELIGDLPIVYSRIPISIETIGPLDFDLESRAASEKKPRLENYVFVTYRGMTELSEYEVDENSVTGMKVNSEQYEIVTLDLKEILFVFPITAMSSMQNHINNIRDDVKNLRLQPISKAEETVSNTDWLFEEIYEFQTRVENSNYEHWFLSNTEAIVVTRTGHELEGKLQSFNHNAIYMEISEDLVTVYMHGIYELKRKTHSKKGKRKKRKRLA